MCMQTLQCVAHPDIGVPAGLSTFFFFCRFTFDFCLFFLSFFYSYDEVERKCLRKNVVKCQDAEQQAHVKSVNRNAGFFSSLRINCYSCYRITEKKSNCEIISCYPVVQNNSREYKLTRDKNYPTKYVLIHE